MLPIHNHKSERVIGSVSCLRRGLVIAVILLSVADVTLAQFTYRLDQTIPVINEVGSEYKLPWAGGLNGPQFNTFDFNLDGIDDLVVFDRVGEKVLTFVSSGTEYKYEPDFEILFPSEITRFLLLVDFNCDGKKDIFTAHSFGIRVFKNVSDTDSIQFEPYFFRTGNSLVEYLVTKGFSGNLNLQLRFDDLPAISDVDGDGDIDVMNMRFQGEGSLEYHRNMSIERYGRCDSLILERETQQWGGFTQCFCEDFTFGDRDCFSQSGRIEHGVGKAVLVLDADGDGAKDILLSEAGCNNIFLLKNRGTSLSPMTEEALKFPQENPVSGNAFPSAYFEDVDFDGVKDLIVAPNVFTREFMDQDFQSSVSLYRNEGTDSKPSFSLISSSFMQAEMIDVGDNSVPAFIDIDRDGDQDMFISRNSSRASLGSIYFYENIGSPHSPVFRFATNDYLQLTSLSLVNIKMQFVDFNDDGQRDLVFMATDRETRTSSVYYILEESGFDLKRIQTLGLAIVGIENVHFADVNRDRLPDALVGRLNGSLQLYTNTGTRERPLFTLSDESFLGLDGSTIRQNLSCHAADLNGDGAEDLAIANGSGDTFIVDDYLSSQGVPVTITNLVFNSISNNHVSFEPGGRGWFTSVNLYESERPQLVAGNSLGGLLILKNEDRAGSIEDLVLSVFPNPLNKATPLSIFSNASGELQIFTALGAVYADAIRIDPQEKLLIDLTAAASGMYVLRFQFNELTVVRRLIVL